jgi:hypothetical protein
MNNLANLLADENRLGEAEKLLGRFRSAENRTARLPFSRCDEQS